MTTYTRPDAQVVNIDEEIITGDFPVLPNSVNGTTAQDPTFEYEKESEFVSNSIWY